MEKKKEFVIGGIRKWQGIRNSDTGEIEDGYLWFITEIKDGEISSIGKKVKGKNRSEAIKNYNLSKNNMDKERRQKCVGCEKMFLESQIIFDSDPFANEIYGDETPVWKCDDCRHESMMDI